MAEPVLRDPASPEPARRPGPQPVRAASPEAAAPATAGAAPAGSGTAVPETAKSGTAKSATANPAPAKPTAAASIDPAHELPSPSAIEAEAGSSANHSAAGRTSGSERTAPQSARTRTTPAAPSRTPTPRPSTARPVKARTASQEMLEELHKRLEDLRERVEKQTSDVGMSLRRELNQDADYVKIRARYYHEHRPLQALGIVAAAGFALGVFVGLWRR